MSLLFNSRCSPVGRRFQERYNPAVLNVLDARQKELAQVRLQVFQDQDEFLAELVNDKAHQSAVEEYVENGVLGCFSIMLARK